MPEDGRRFLAGRALPSPAASLRGAKPPPPRRPHLPLLHPWRASCSPRGTVHFRRLPRQGLGSPGSPGARGRPHPEFQPHKERQLPEAAAQCQGSRLPAQPNLRVGRWALKPGQRGRRRGGRCCRECISPAAPPGLSEKRIHAPPHPRSHLGSVSSTQPGSWPIFETAESRVWLVPCRRDKVVLDKGAPPDCAAVKGSDSRAMT